ncbi:hypothetical protein M758_12G030800 [Ceratodon purpureus]|uniref:ethanolamine kinase n=1 Tax=Ceratodon purpureus TaxID=3225 RepID=A0A8T0G387_CERPU|nr:hypothetical protein KC19_12G031000 [Ceratodon purpureus]KAG0597917.1 hypothetical protein M758_12G030800 [Ceratodon purpureus]KAG0597924.1 hypothetical protein M758_12G030800 [Ceratodon purpureus]
MTDKVYVEKSRESGVSSNMAVRTCSLSVDTRLPESALHSQVRGVCKALLRKWAEVDDSKISVSKVTGGISNMMLKAEVDSENEKDLQPVTVRVFGPDSDAVIDRDRELQAITYISSAGFGAKLLGVFGNGMVQSFLVGETLDHLEMAKPEMAKLIAMEVRRLHELEVPGSKEPQLWHDLYKFIDRGEFLLLGDLNPNFGQGIMFVHIGRRTIYSVLYECCPSVVGGLPVLLRSMNFRVSLITPTKFC